MKTLFRFLCLTLFMFIAVSSFAGEPRGMQARSNYVKVWHDDSGIPHVVASTTAGVFWGYGYCVGKDRMFQMELLRRSTEGTLSEVFGKDFIEVDFLARRDRVPFDELQDGLNRTSNTFRSSLSAFTNGLNRSISDCRSGKFKMDPAFKKAGIHPSPFSELQVLNLFAGTMAARYNDFTQELDNLHLLNMLVRKYGSRAASNIFEDVIFYEDPKVFTTLGDVTYFKPGFRYPPHIGTKRGISSPVHSPGLRNQKRNRVLKSTGIPDKSGSYGIVLSDQANKKAWMLGGPQMGYFKPSAVYSIGLHTPEFDIVGTTPVGYIFIMFAANRNLAFTATAGVGNLVDLIVVKPSEEDKDVLIGGNFNLRKKVRKEQIFVKGQKSPEIREVVDTKIGPVIADENGVYYVKSRGWKDRVVDSYAGWFDSTFARTIDEWLDASDRNALSINWIAADRNANISFVHCGLGKSRNSFGDDRLPVTVPPVFPFPDKRLAGKNPETGFYVNWNCPPVKGYRDGDLQTGWAADQRSRYIAEHVRINSGWWSTDYLKKLDKDIAFTDQRAFFFKDFLMAFIDKKKFTPLTRNAYEILASWDNTRTDFDSDGKFDHKGAGLFEAFWNEIFNDVFGETLNDFAWMVGSDSTWTQSSLLAKALLRESNFNYLGNKKTGDVVFGAFSKAVMKMTQDGLNIIDADCPKMEFAGVNHLGVPTMTSEASFSPFMNRGTDVQIVELDKDGIKVFGCMPPGNSEFGKFEKDQMKNFQNFVFKPRALTMKEVRHLGGRFMVLQP